jgi:ATP-dependent protease HslVU (ClpYQ) peptidase subunit
MTTVTYRDGVMASDSKSSSGNTYDGNVVKIRKVILIEDLSWVERLVFRKEPKEVPMLVGYAGAVADCLDYIDTLFFGMPQSKQSYEANVLAITGDGQITLYDGTSLRGVEIHSDYASIGSGSEIALGAMFVGANAMEAVEAAIHLDNTSGGDIQVVTFDDE